MLDPEVRDLSDRLVKSIANDTFFANTEDYFSHVTRHVMINDFDLLNRVLSDKGSYVESKYDKDTKRANTGFASMDEAKSSIEECIIFKSKEIAEWALNPQEKNMKAFSVTLPTEDGYDPVGYGYIVDRKTNKISYYESNTICIVLKKEHGPYSKFGFNLHTAYPDITHPDHRIDAPDNGMKQLLRQTKTFKKASPVSKAYMLCQIDHNNSYLVTFKEGFHHDPKDDVLSIQIPYKDENGDQWRHTIRIKEDRIDFSTSKLIDVNIATSNQINRNGRKSEKIIYPGEDLKKYQKDGVEIKKAKRYVKQETPLTEKYCHGKGHSVSLLNKEAFHDFEQLHPKAAQMVAMCSRQLNFKNMDTSYENVTLNESLLPHTYDNSMESALCLD